MSHAIRMIAEAQARREKALADGDTAEVRTCDGQIARWERVKQDVDKAPPLSPAQRDQLRVLLASRAVAEPVISVRRQRAATPKAA